MVSVVPFDTLVAEQQERAAAILTQATRLSESATLSAGEHLAAVVQGAQASLGSVKVSLSAVGQEHHPKITAGVESQDRTVQVFVRDLAPLMEEQLRLVNAGLACLRGMVRCADRVAEVSAATRILQLCTRVEIAHLDKAGQQFVSTVAEMQKLNGVTDELNRSLSALAVALRDILPKMEVGVARMAAETQRFEADFGDSLSKVERDGAALVEAVSRSLEGLSASTTLLVAASHRALSALQFQDRMIQDLQRLDSLIGEIRAMGASGQDTHLAFRANLGDLMEPAADALEGGEMLMF